MSATSGCLRTILGSRPAYLCQAGDKQTRERAFCQILMSRPAFERAFPCRFIVLSLAPVTLSFPLPSFLINLKGAWSGPLSNNGFDFLRTLWLSPSVFPPLMEEDLLFREDILDQTSQVPFFPSSRRRLLPSPPCPRGDYRLRTLASLRWRHPTGCGKPVLPALLCGDGFWSLFRPIWIPLHCLVF